MARISKAQVGKKIDPKLYLQGSRKRVKAVVDSARKQEVKKGINTYGDYLKSKIKKQRSGGKTKPKKALVGLAALPLASMKAKSITKKLQKAAPTMLKVMGGMPPMKKGGKVKAATSKKRK